MKKGVLRRRFGEQNYFKVTIGDCGYSTLYYDKALVIPKNVKVYYVVGVVSMNGSNHVLMKRVDGNIIPLNFGVVIEGLPGTYKFQYASKQQTLQANATTISNGTNIGNILLGVNESTPVSELIPQDKVMWILQCQLWNYITSSSTINLPAHKCYYLTDIPGGGGGGIIDSIIAFIYRPNKLCSVKIINDEITSESTKSSVFGNEDYSNVLILILNWKSDISQSSKFNNVLNFSNIFFDEETDWLELTDLVGIYIPSYFKHANALSYSRLNVSTYNDVCLPVSIPQNVILGFTEVFRLTGYDTKPIFSGIQLGEVLAGEPIIIKVDGILDINIDKVEGNYKITRNPRIIIQYNNDKYSIKFKGTFNTISSKPFLDYNYYKVKPDSLGFTDLSFPLSSFRSYIETKDDLSEFNPKPYIHFEDPLVEQICLEHFDTDEDGRISYEEAENVLSLGYYSGQYPSSFLSYFDSLPIHTFNELKYFTGLKLNDSERSGLEHRTFYNCDLLESISIPNNMQIIYSGVFDYCKSLRQLNIPKSINRMYSSFTEVPLEKAVFDSVESICNTYFNGRYSNPLYYTKKVYTNESPNEITDLIIPDTVTRINSYSFYNCSNLNSVDISENVTWIGDDAFYNCSKLNSLSIPNGVTYIGSGAFYNCTGIDGELIIPASVKSMGNEAFYNCSGIDLLVIQDGVLHVNGFKNCKNISNPLVIPDSVVTVDAFGNCSKIPSVSIGNSVSTIYYNAFSGCSGLQKAEFVNLDKLLDIRLNAKTNNPLTLAHHLYFRDIENEITSITIPENKYGVGNYTFSGCSFLTNVEFPEGGIVSKYDAVGHKVKINITLRLGTESGKYTLKGGDFKIVANDYSDDECISCEEAYQKIDIGHINGYIESKNYYILGYIKEIRYNQYDNDNRTATFVICDDLTVLNSTRLYIENCAISGIRSIGSYAFSGCSGLSSINFPSKLAYIGNYAFEKCSGINSIEFYSFEDSSDSSDSSDEFDGYDITIESYAFTECSSLQWLYLSKNVTSIKSTAFVGCPDLLYVTIDANNPKYLYVNNAIIGKDDNTLYFGTKHTTTIPNTITKINDYAFSNNSKSGVNYATSFTIPNSVTIIGTNAFTGFNLSEINLPKGLETLLNVGNPFTNNPNLEHIKWNNDVGEDNTIFRIVNDLLIINETNVLKLGCKNSGKEKLIEKSGELISYRVLGTCESDDSSDDNYVEEIARSAFSSHCPDRIIFNSSISKISSNSFSGCDNLKEIDLSRNSKLNIEASAFGGCVNLTDITFGDDCENLTITKSALDTTGWYTSKSNGLVYLVYPKYLFCYKGSAPSNLIIPGGVLYIGDNAFYQLSTIEKITIPNSVIFIKEDAFNGPKLKEVRYEGTFEDFLRIKFKDSGLFSCNPKLYINNTLLEGTITIPSSITTISDYVFLDFGLAETIIIEEGVETIGEYSFDGMDLRKVIIPSTITEIKEGAFCGSWVEEMLCYIENPISIDEQTFDCIDSTCILYVPENSVNLYRNSIGWKNFTVKSLDEYEESSSDSDSI